MHDEVDPPYTTNNLKTHIFILILFPMVCSALILGTVGFLLKERDIQNQFLERGEIILLHFKALGEHPIVNHDKTTLEKFANELIESDSVRSVHLYSTIQKNSQTLPGTQATSTALTKETIKTVFRSGPRMKPIGRPHLLKNIFSSSHRFKTILETSPGSNQALTLELELDHHWVLIWQREILIFYWFINIVCMIFTMLFANYFATKYSNPIRAISFATSRIREGRLSTRVKYRAPKGELQGLTWGINSMAQSLQNANDEMQQSIDQATQDLRDTLETIEVQNIELDISRKEAEHANRIKSQFLANISHEIRTPLNSISGFTRLLMKSELSSKQSDQLNTIHKSSGNLLAIINDILDFSKIEAGKLSLNMALVDIRKILNEVSEILSPLAKEQGLDQILLVDDNVPKTILSDPLRIKQILTNLINNAIKFSEQGSLTIRVAIENYKSELSHIKFSVSDKGIGLSEASKNKLFEAFHQSDSSNVRRFQGTGLGLTISRQLVEMLGGEIGVESTLGQGSTFWFTLPSAKVNDTSFKPTEKFQTESARLKLELSKSEFTGSELSSFELQTPKILAVDDNSANLKLLCALLDELDVQYDACKSGREAIILSKEKEYDLIFMDIQMPNLDGIETTKHIREFDNRFSRSRAIVALTAHALEEEKKNLINNGFNDCLTKPIDMDLLIATIEHWTGYKKDFEKKPAPSFTPVPLATSSPLNIIDTQEGIRLAGGKLDLANEMLDMLMNNLLRDWLAIEDLAKKNNQDQLLEKVHYLHGACRYCGVPLLQEALAELEGKLKKRKSYQQELQTLNKAINALLKSYNSMAKPIHG